MKLKSINPHDYSVNDEVAISTEEEITNKVKQANIAKLQWKELGLTQRIKLLTPIWKDLKSKSEEIANLIVQETGKPITESKSEAAGYVEEFEWFMNHVKDALKDETTHEDDEFIHRIVREPFGVAAVITPWNFPFGMAIWGIVPNLIAGNTVVLKVSEECPLMGKFIEKVFDSHDLPKGVFSVVHGDGQVGRQLAESDVNLIWFTGSTKVGKSLYKLAADKFIKVILEMGGSNPGLVFEDVNVSDVIPKIYSGRFYNCGQVCDATKRLIVHESILSQVVGGLAKHLGDKNVDNPTKSTTDIGPLVAKRQLDLLKEQVDDAVSKGAKVIAGGDSPKGSKGAYFQPTILTNITKDMRVWGEEVFGPVLPVISFTTEDEAVELANDTSYGLGSKLFTKDKDRIARVSSRIQAGTVEVNSASRWLCCNPFGGYKQSGMGREHGTVGFHEITQIKVISQPK